MTKKSTNKQGKKSVENPAPDGGDPATADATPASPKPKRGKREGAKAEAPAVKKLSGLDAAARLLAQAPEPIRVGALTEAIIAQGLWSPGGATPAATLYSAILREIQVKGKASRFVKTARGLFAYNGAPPASA